jgi:hypothetical protein
MTKWKKTEGDYIIGVDPCEQGSGRSVIHVSEIGYWSIDDTKNIEAVPYLGYGTQVTHMSINGEELGDPSDPEWWTRLIVAIHNKADEIMHGRRARMGDGNKEQSAIDHAFADVCKQKITELTSQKDGAYRERNQCVALLSKLLPAWIEQHQKEGEEWDSDWKNIVFIELPTGLQATWHVHDSELGMFAHLEKRDTHSWDGHTTEEKYERMAKVPQGGKQ